MSFPDDVPTLISGDVTLRAHRVEDVDAVVEQCTDPVSVEWLTVPLGYTADDAREYLTRIVPAGWESGSELAFAIEATHPSGERRFSGTVSLRDEGSRRAELAFGAHPAIRGRGVMTTAVGLLLDWGFETRDLETVSWLANHGNVASRRLAWKSGFTFAGTVRRWLVHRGEYRDAWVGSLHREDSRDPKTRWLESPVLAGARVRLRPLASGDLDRIVEGCTDPLTRHFLPFLPGEYDRQAAAAYLISCSEQASTGTAVTWAVADPETDDFMAVVGIPRMGRRQGEIGYWAHPQGRGRGLMSEAVGHVVRHAFVDESDGGLGMQRLFLKTAGTNAASARVARRNGFTEVGRERQAVRLDDEVLDDLILFDLLRGEWQQ